MRLLCTVIRFRVRFRVKFRVRVRVRVRVRLKVLLTRLTLGVLHAFIREWLDRSHYPSNMVSGKSKSQASRHGTFRETSRANDSQLRRVIHLISTCTDVLYWSAPV